jgi:hypothetical protein
MFVSTYKYTRIVVLSFGIILSVSQGGGLLRVYSCFNVLQIGLDSKRLQVRGSLYRSPAPSCLIGLGPIRFLVPLFRQISR